MNKPVIICVDDESTVLSSLRQQLKRHFQSEYLIEALDKGEDALELIVELLVDNVDVPVVISDQIMPGMKGNEMLREVHKISPNTLAVLLTGQASTEAIGDAVNQGNLYRYIAKPWEQADLIMTISEAARSYFQEKKLNEQNSMLQEMNRNLNELNQELKKRLEIFYKFVPNQFLRLLHLNEYDNIAPGHCLGRVMSVMFADIRDFTSLSERLKLNESFRFINSYYSHISPAIRKHNGFIDKYIGDAIMALYETADEAVTSSLEMLLILENYNLGRQRAGYEPIHIGIGINTGELMMGTVGEEDRIQTTVIGDMVNLSARVENMSKYYGVPLLITHYTLESLRHPENFRIRLLGHARIRGKQQGVTLYEVVDANPSLLNNPVKEITATFTQAVESWLADDMAGAERLFQACFEQCPEDKPTRMYLDRLGTLEKGEVELSPALPLNSGSML